MIGHVHFRKNDCFIFKDIKKKKSISDYKSKLGCIKLLQITLLFPAKDGFNSLTYLSVLYWTSGDCLNTPETKLTMSAADCRPSFMSFIRATMSLL